MFSETMIKTLLKAVDFEKLQAQLLADPRVHEALAIANSIRDDFATIKLAQAEILSRLDKLADAIENRAAKPAKRGGSTIDHQPEKD